MGAETNHLLTLTEVAQELRCSKAHVSNLIAGRVKGSSHLPMIPLGRRKLVRRESLERWKIENERSSPGDDMIRLSGIYAVNAKERGAFNA